MFFKLKNIFKNFILIFVCLFLSGCFETSGSYYGGGYYGGYDLGNSSPPVQEQLHYNPANNAMMKCAHVTAGGQCAHFIN